MLLQRVLYLTLEVSRTLRVENLKSKTEWQTGNHFDIILNFHNNHRQEEEWKQWLFFTLITNSLFLKQYQNFNDSYILWMSIMNTTTLTFSMFCNLICWQFLFSPAYYLQERGEISTQSKEREFIRQLYGFILTLQ